MTGPVRETRNAYRATQRRPEIVVLCGSTRFYDEFQAANYELTMAGRIVLTVGFYPHAAAQGGHGEGVGHDSAQKAALDELHRRKIDLADRVLVLNIGGYIGESTRSEIAYAEQIGKPVDYTESTDRQARRNGDWVGFPGWSSAHQGAPAGRSGETGQVQP